MSTSILTGFGLLLVGIIVLGAPIHQDYIPARNSPENIAVLLRGNYQQNIEELSGQFEGDLVLNDQQENSIKEHYLRNGLKDTTRRWTGNIIPYNFTVEFSQENRSAVFDGMQAIEAAAPCLRFVQRTNEVDFIKINVGINN